MAEKKKEVTISITGTTLGMCTIPISLTVAKTLKKVIYPNGAGMIVDLGAIALGAGFAIRMFEVGYDVGNAWGGFITGLMGHAKEVSEMIDKAMAQPDDEENEEDLEPEVDDLD